MRHFRQLCLEDLCSFLASLTSDTETAYVLLLYFFINYFNTQKFVIAEEFTGG